MLIKNLTKFSLILGLILFASCSEDDTLDNGGNEEEMNSTAVYITDSPVDDGEVDAIFITVADVMINGESIEGFNKTTIEISSLTKGRTELLGELDLEAGTASDITLTLSETDSSGNGPGNYVMTSGGAKEEITTATEINISDEAEIFADAQNELILDFDLRKSLKQDGGTYSFVSESQLENNIRAVNKADTGFVTGSVDNTSEANGEVVVAYAYQEGSFDESESSANSEGINFSNAVSSSAVSDSNGEFEIHFLEEGDYELHFASYSDIDDDGKLEFSGMVEASTASSLDLSGFTVDANSEVNLQITFTGLLGL
ncbi:DUF4382 domain-containing protein [Christiangramia echinicola]|uniref:DUF4382 domain-containing protein n=1 Tax=Christiangramia echinicola TaxID=279359 RepID=A0A1H1NXI2_9FLAO|nr:DUF4382 domain-containing protein [Christiangramia echinicola]SDS03505.1 protein of unknown function [Christiangramia echinicola]